MSLVHDDDDCDGDDTVVDCGDLAMRLLSAAMIVVVS